MRTLLLFIAEVLFTWVSVMTIVFRLAGKGGLREVFGAFGIELPYFHRLHYLFRKKNVRHGWEQWQYFHQRWKNSGSSQSKPEAYAKALAVVKKLAPEVRIAFPGTSSEELRGSKSIVATRLYINGNCCSNTFAFRDNGIPTTEKALNLYLWAKLFPERYQERPTRTKWGE